jgi:hypothetical protein
MLPRGGRKNRLRVPVKTSCPLQGGLRFSNIVKLLLGRLSDPSQPSVPMLCQWSEAEKTPRRRRINEVQEHV